MESMGECGAVLVAARLNGCSEELALVASRSSLVPAGGSETPNERFFFLCAVYLNRYL